MRLGGQRVPEEYNGIYGTVGDHCTYLLVSAEWSRLAPVHFKTCMFHDSGPCCACGKQFMVFEEFQMQSDEFQKIVFLFIMGNQCNRSEERRARRVVRIRIWCA